MIDGTKIKEQMEVKGSDGKHVGTVDGVEGRQLKLASGGMYHYVDMDMIETVENGIVCLKKTADETTRPWH
jgi:hypothetical protein